MRRHHALPPAAAALLLLFALAPLPPLASHASAPAQRRTTQRRPRQTPARPRTDYTTFSHRTAAHRSDCASCHRTPTPNWRAARAADAFPDVADYPDHSACLRCHKQQFFRGAVPPICSVCHVKTSPRDGARFPFPTLVPATRGPRRGPAPSQFATNFPHDIHQDVMARLSPDLPAGVESNRSDAAAVSASGLSFVRASFQQAGVQQAAAAQRPVDSCSMCHQTFEPQGASDVEEMTGRPQSVEASGWPRKGTFKTSPVDHSSCFNCHWQDGGVAPPSSDCAACHRLLPSDRPTVTARADADASIVALIPSAHIRAKWLRRESARFRHEVEKHEGLGCTACHIRMSTVSTLDPASLEVSILTCGGTGTGCHIKARPKAILNVEVDQRRADARFQCVKCHLNFGREATPKSHTDPVPAPKQ
jgi:hypothetical protein